MSKPSKFVGLDVHKDMIAVATCDPEGHVECLGQIPHTEVAIRRTIKHLGAAKTIHVVYEAGPCGYALYRLLVGMGVSCQVIAPSLVPKKPSDRVKTDRRDAMKLARAACHGDLTPVRVPTAQQEAFRDVIRARESCLKDLGRARHRVLKLLLRQNVRPPASPTGKSMRAWTQRHWEWVKSVRLEQPALQVVLEDGRAEIDRQTDRIHRFEKIITEEISRLDAVTRETIEGLQALRGIKVITAATIASEMGPASRFASPPRLMSYAGLTSSEYSSGGKQSRGAITKCGNAHLRRVIVEAAWTYSRRLGNSAGLRKRRAPLPPEVLAIALKAEHRLHARYCKFVVRGKPNAKAAVAVGRELLGFIWAIGTHIEHVHAQRATPAAA